MKDSGKRENWEVVGCLGLIAILITITILAIKYG